MEDAVKKRLDQLQNQVHEQGETIKALRAQITEITGQIQTLKSAAQH